MTFDSEYKKVIKDPEYFKQHYYLELNPMDLGNIEKRKLKFQEDLMLALQSDIPLASRFKDDDRGAFIEYWTQTGKRGGKMRFEKQDMFHFAGRVRTWMSHKVKFNTIKLTQKLFNGRSQKF